MAIFGSRAHGGFGIGSEEGTNNTLAQINVDGTIAVEATGFGSNQNNVLPAFDSRGYKASGIGLVQGSNVNLGLFSGGKGRLPAINLEDVGSCDPNGFIDRTSYNTSNISCAIRELDGTTDPEDWRTAQAALCRFDLESCDGTSCHYVQERLQALTTATDSNQLILLSRQEYPLGTEDDQTQGIFRITRLTPGDTTPPALDTSFGEEVEGSLLYPPGPSGFIQPDASLVSQVVDEQQLTCLYAPENSGGIQLARFPLNGADDTYQVITDNSLPGKPVLLSDSGSALWMQEGNSRIRRYDLDENGVRVENADNTYNLLNSMHACRPVMAVGKDGQWLYIARTWAENQQVIMERFNLQTTRQDDNWIQVLDGMPVAANPYDLMVEDNQIVLLPRGVVTEQNGETSLTSPGLQVNLLESGGCAEWKTTQVITTDTLRPANDVTTDICETTTDMPWPTTTNTPPPTTNTPPPTTDIYGSTTDIYGSTTDIYGSTTDIYGSTTDTYEPTTNILRPTNDGLITAVLTTAGIGLSVIATSGGVICYCVIKAERKKTKRTKNKRSSAGASPGVLYMSQFFSRKP